ncbi:unnamed protein product [Linum trigynum]|uniref:Uncharacterized protein n=1 Tax=Linum trigynum TaxID=586398 RepID=A0AAV2F677_9ROSI
MRGAKLVVWADFETIGGSGRMGRELSGRAKLCLGRELDMWRGRHEVGRELRGRAEVGPELRSGLICTGARRSSSASQGLFTSPVGRGGVF